MKLDRDKMLRARELMGYGLEKTAAEAGVSKNSVLRAEHEEDIRPLTARKIARALGVNVADLLTESPPKKAEAPLSQEWALSIPDEAFRRGIESTPTEQLWGLTIELVAGEQPRLFESERRDKPSAGELYRRSTLFARALIVRDELLQRGEEPPEKQILALRRYMNALELSEDPNLGRYKAEKIFPPEQVAAFLTEDERANERIREQAADMSADEIRKLVLAHPPLRRLAEAYRLAERQGQSVQDETA